MKKATCIVSLLMALALVLMGMGPVLATADQPPAIQQEDPLPYPFTIHVDPGHGEAWLIPPAPGDPGYPAYRLTTFAGVGEVEGVVYPPGYEVTLSYILPQALEPAPGADPLVRITFDDPTVAPGLFTAMNIYVYKGAPGGEHVIAVVGTCPVGGGTVEDSFMLYIHLPLPFD
ncbi:hypothetical protein M1O52_03910, partial [Dehalococcoidia bacterium]|nr:hypothetical protein [Dehalococcoidia bacterium]